MISPRPLALLALSFLAADVVACSKGDSHPAPVATSSPASGQKPTGTAAAPTGNLPDVMTPDDALARFAADKTSMMGKTVKVKGYYFNYTKEGDALNVEVTAKPDISSKGPLCIFPATAKAALDKVKKHDMITVSGTVDGEFFGRPKLKACKLE
ncbi:MAG: hypothetical protein ABJE95_07250 [Byssovorax sp.]